MKVRKIRQVISTLLTTALLFSLMSMSAFAADTTVGLSFDVLDLSVQNYNSKETFLDSYASTAAPLSSNSNTSAPSISDFHISGNGNSVLLGLSINEQSQSFTGSIYPVVGGGYYDDKLVLGDFSATSDYNIVSFRAETFPDAGAFLRLILEDLYNGEVYDINLELTNSQFTILHQVAVDYYSSLGIEPNTDDYVAIMQKTISLMQISKNWSDSTTNEAVSPLAWATPYNYDSISTSNTGLSVTRATLNSFFDKMDSTGSTGYTYSSTSAMGKILNQLGWKVYHNKTASAPYFYVSYGVDNSGASRLVQLILCGYSTTYNSGSGYVESHLQVYGSVLVEWDTSYDIGKCKVVYYSGGPELTDVYLCSSELAGTNTIFTESGLSFSLYSNKDPWLGFLISRIPKYGSLITDIWDALTVSNAEVSKWAQGYEVTVDAQNAAGGLIKDICARSKTASLLSVGNYLHLKGEVLGTYSSHKIKFQFTAENII